MKLRKHKEDRLKTQYSLMCSNPYTYHVGPQGIGCNDALHDCLLWQPTLQVTCVRVGE